jgi:hypothetical protein
MNHDPLRQFSRQLARWAEDLLLRSRSPLRKIDLSPEVSTARGPLHPDLVIWVNRDSCMAGGVILVPAQETADTEDQGRHCALALGLRHFVVWGAREITFWEVGPTELTRHKQFPAPPRGSEAAGFRLTLATVLEELKYLTVAGAIAPDDLSPHYFVNLCQGALEDTAAALTELMRMARSENCPGTDGSSPERQSRNKALLTLVRLAALLHFDQLPAKAQPEGLERAMLFALDTLPERLRNALLPGDNELPLPLEAAVRFHHLLRRLTQLGGCEDRPRLTRLLEQLLARHQQELGLVTLTPGFPRTAGPRLVVNARGIPPCNGDLEVAAPSALAFSALLRHLQGQPEASVQVWDPFLLPGDQAPRVVVAALLAPFSVPARERATLHAKLRLSWPTRRFRLPPTLPRWGWELLHLVGLAAADAQLLLRTPGNWFAAPFAQSLLDVLLGECSIREIRRVDSGGLDLLLIKDGGYDIPLLVSTPEGSRTFEGGLLRTAPASLWALAVGLCAPLWELLENRLLRPVTADDWPQELESGVVLFAHSTLGLALWQVLGLGQPLPDRERLPAILKLRHFPLPKREMLAHLQRLALEHPRELPSQSCIDAELAPWFSPPPPRPAQPEPAAAPPAMLKKDVEVPDYAFLKEVLQREVFQDGVPVFPEHYLFTHFRPRLQEYRFTPPLLRGEQFFGQVTLKDQAGQSLQTPTLEMAQALELISDMGRQGVSLPTDPLVLEDILDRYLHDLRTLHRALQRRVHALVADPRQAQRISRRLWSDLGLPGPEAFLSHEK